MATTYSSNLTRFRPRIAAKASGTPLQRYQQTVKDTQKTVISRRRLPLTQQQAQASR